MKPTYDEVVKKVARYICKADMMLPDEYTPSGHIRWTLYKTKAKGALRAMQDMMPDCEFDYGATKDRHDAIMYNHIKTLGRDKSPSHTKQGNTDNG